MLASTLLVGLLASLGALAGPIATPDDLTPPAEYVWEITNYKLIASPGGTSVNFDIAGPKYQDFPAFKTHCSATSSNKKYVPCKAIPNQPNKDVYTKFTFPKSGGLRLFVNYEVHKQPSFVYDAYGNRTLTGAPSAFQMVPSRFTAIG